MVLADSVERRIVFHMVYGFDLSCFYFLGLKTILSGFVEIDLIFYLYVCLDM